MVVGTNDDSINRPNVAHMMTNSADARAEMPSSDDSIGSFMIVFSPVLLFDLGWCGRFLSPIHIEMNQEAQTEMQHVQYKKLLDRRWASRHSEQTSQHRIKEDEKCRCKGVVA